MAQSTSVKDQTTQVVMPILLSLSLCHLLNDMIQSLLPAIYPILKQSFQLSFEQIGLITFTNQLTASLLQPVVGWYTDRHPKPFSLACGMCSTLCGLLWLSQASAYWQILCAAALIGVGSSIFHPESSRMARSASGGRHGLAQSLFQVGGNAGTAIGPLLAAFIILPQGQRSIAWFCGAALLAISMLIWIGRWFSEHLRTQKTRKPIVESDLPRQKVRIAIAVLITLVFSKYIYLSSIVNFYTFYLIHHFGVSVQNAQVHLFVFLAAVAAGTFGGGPLGDRIGRKYVIWISILGVLPFTMMLPYADLTWTGILSAIIGMVLASAFSAIIVYAQDLLPGKVGTVAGLFFGLAFGLAGLAAAVIGNFADTYGIDAVYRCLAFLPALGILTVLLPDLHRRKAADPAKAV